MRNYSKPVLLKFTDQEIMEKIFLGASCPNCYNGGTYIVISNEQNCEVKVN